MLRTLFKHRWLFVGLVLTLTSCGFHLRGLADMPRWLNNIHIVIDSAHQDLLPLVSAQLEAYHIQINPDPAQASYWLIIEQDGLQQRVTSISSSTTPRQYQLIYTLQFKLQRNHGPEILSSRTVTVTRQLTVNSNRILGSNDEGARLEYEMRQEAAIQLVNRLSAAHEP